MTGPFLIVVTGKAPVGQLGPHTVWRVVSTELVRLSNLPVNLTAADVRL